MDTEKSTPASWLERVEDIINVLEGSSIGEFELTEGGTEIIIRRSPAMVLMAVPSASDSVQAAGAQGSAASRAAKVDLGIPLVAPLTGVYYSATSPTSPVFVNIGDVVQRGQIVALVEAMKVFNEITTDITGRVVSIVATNGSVVQKGDVILRIEAI